MKASNKKQTPTRVWLHGASGRMGQEIQTALSNERYSASFKLAGGSSRKFEKDLFFTGEDLYHNKLHEALQHAELIIDFSSAQGNALLLKAVMDSKMQGQAVLIGSTGLEKAQWAQWKKLSQNRSLRVLEAPNTSIGIFLLTKILASYQSVLSELGFDIEIVETHHRNKKDSPSGTALLLAAALSSADGKKVFDLVCKHEGLRKQNTIGIHSVRGGSVFGEHVVRFLGEDEEISIEHRALSRQLFAKGALRLCSWLIKQKAGYYGLSDVKL